MTRIGICDDELEIIDRLGVLLKQKFDEYNETTEIINYNSSMDLIDDLAEKQYYDLLFLDIKMPEKSGIEIASFLREVCHNDLTQIVFISSESGYAMKLFEARPMDFLLKPINEKQIDKIVKLAIRLIENNRSVFQFKNRDQLIKVKMADIEYFESSMRKIKLVTKNEEYSFYDKLDNVYEQVKEYNFLYVHKSFVVNAAHVKLFSAKHLIMSNGIQIPISRNKRGEIKALWK